MSLHPKLKVLLPLICLSWAAEAEDKWLRLSTPHFEIYTDAGVGKGREVLRRFEQIRQVVLKATSSQTTPGPPVRIFVFRSEKEFESYKDPRRKTMAGFYQPGRDRDYIAMQNTGPEIYRVVFHEYVHVVMKHTGIPVPLWFNEGTAELFSTVETTNSEIKIGNLLPWHIFTLRRQKLIDLPTLMAVEHGSALYNEESKVGIFYAESWAFVHMLNMHPRYTSGRIKFLELALTGTPPEQAFQQAYGKSTQEVLHDLQDYVNANQYRGALLKTDPLETIDKIEPDQLASSESGLALADLLISLGKSREAERHLQKLAETSPKVAGIEEGLGDAALAEHQDNQALAHYQRAIDLGSKNARIYFEKAAIVRDSKGDLKQTVKDLNKAIEIDPGYWQARHLLGYLYMQDHRYSEAVSQLRAAAHLKPRNVNIWENLALALFYSGEKDLALTAARQGRALATRPNEIEALDGTIRQIETPAIQSGNRLSEPASEKWRNRKGNQRLEGQLVQLDCHGKAARFHVVVGAEELILRVDDPSKVVLTNAPGQSVELTCGTFPPRNVSIEYVAAPIASEKSAGEITALEFK